MKSKEIKNKDTAELLKEVTRLRKSLSEFYGNTSGSKARDVKEARNIRKDIARFLTEINTRKEK
jgi:ribosomal protein L29